MPTATHMSLASDMSEISTNQIKNTQDGLQELVRDTSIINDYGEAVNPVEFNPDNCVESLAYSSRRSWDTSNAYTAEESRVWQLLHFLHSQPSLEKICGFFWGQIDVSKITSDVSDTVFWSLATGRKQEAAQFCQKLERWDLKSLIESGDGKLVRDHCENVLRSGVGFPLWEIGIYSLLCGDLEHALSLCGDWEQELSVRLTCALNRGLDSPHQIGEIMALLRNSQIQETANAAARPYHRIITAIMLGKVPEFLEEDIHRLIPSDSKMPAPETDQCFLSNVRLNCHLAIVFGVSPISEPAIQAYIEILLLSSSTQLIPSYVRFLDSEVQSATYGAALGRIAATKEQQSVQLAFAHRYHINAEVAVISLLDTCFNGYQGAKSIQKDLPDLDPISEEDSSMISALTWLSLLQKWDLLAEAYKQLLDIWLPGLQIRSALGLNEQIPLSKVLTVSHHEDPNSQLMLELAGHSRILAFLSSLESKKYSSEGLLVRINQVDQYLATEAVDLKLRQFYVFYCYDQFFKYLEASQSSGTLLLDLATHIGSRTSVLNLLNSNNFLADLMKGITTDVTKHPEHIISY